MREVSQKWLNNQNKTLRDQGLLRLDFLSAHDNNAYAHIIPMGSDANKSNINEIKEIYPYGAPTKNLAMPNLTGKEYLGNGIYRVYNNNGITVDYNVYSGVNEINGTNNSITAFSYVSYIFDSSFNPMIMSFHPISGTRTDGFSSLTNYSASGTPEAINSINLPLDNNVSSVIVGDPYVNEWGLNRNLNIYISGDITFNNYQFKLQLEKGSTATDYVVPQPNTGYVSTAITNPDGTLTPAGSDYYTLNQPIAELNNHSLREVFESTTPALENLIMNGDIPISLNTINTPIYSYFGTFDIGVYYILVKGKIIGVPYPYSFGFRSDTTEVSNSNSPSFSTSYSILNFNLTTTSSGTNLRLTRNILTDNILDIDNIMVFNLTDLFGVTATSGTEYDNAVAKIEWVLSKNDGYIQIVGNPFKIVDLTIAQMDYWFSVYQAVRVVPIEVNIENYRSPLNGLTITWSENFGHAVDYSIEYNGEIYTYLNNTKKTVFVPIIVENTLDANFKIRVNKWSQGNVPIRIERVFVGLHIINYQDRIFSYSKKRVNDVLSLELPQDEINFELSNIDRMFDPLWYNSYFKYLNEKTEIRVYSGFRLDGKNAEWIKNGTFYLNDWKAPNNSITASFTARDILNLLDADEMYSKSGALTLDDYCDIILGRDYKGVDNFENYNLPVNPDGSKKWNIRKNLAVPDLTGKPEISEGVYRLYDANGVTIDYDYWTGEFTINGTSTTISLGGIFSIPTLQDDFEYTISRIYVSGTKTSIVNIYMGFPTQQILENTQNQNTFIAGNDNRTFIFSDLNIGGIFNDYKFKLQLEKGVEATDYELPIENANVPVSMETRTKREVLQLLAQSVNAHIHLDDDANISFIRDVTGQQLNADKKIMFTKPEFNIAAPVKKIIVPISTYTSDPNELELARIQVTAGETIEINHDLPYSGGRVEVSEALTVASQDNTWFRSYKIVVGGSGSGELVLFRHQMARTTINILQDVGSSGTTMTYENPMIDTKLKASRALTKIWSEISNSRQVEFDLRIDPLFNTLDAVSFPFKVLNLEQTEFMRIDELEINYNGAYKGKIKGVILSNYGGDLTDKTYIKHTKEFNSGEENLKWHLSNK